MIAVVTFWTRFLTQRIVNMWDDGGLQDQLNSGDNKQ
jgi:hypothetical protein